MIAYKGNYYKIPMNDNTLWQVIGYILPLVSKVSVVIPVLQNSSFPEKYFFPNNLDTDIRSNLKEVPKGAHIGEVNLGGPNFQRLDKPIKYNNSGLYILQPNNHGGLLFADLGNSTTDFVIRHLESLLESKKSHHEEDLKKLQGILKKSLN